MNKIFRAINLNSSNFNDHLQLLLNKIVTSCSNSFLKIPLLYYKKDDRVVGDSQISNMSKTQNRPRLDSIQLPPSPIKGNSRKVQEHLDSHGGPVNDIEFIPLLTCPTVSKFERCEEKFPIEISRPQEDKLDFYVLDTSSTPVKVDLSYLSSTSRSRVVGSKSKLKCSKKSSPSIEIVGLVTSSPKTDLFPIINLEEDEDEIIFEGSQSADFISLQNYKKSGISSSKNKTNFVQKRLSHSDCKKCPKCKKIKISNYQEMSNYDSSTIDERDLSLLDSSIIAVSQTSNIKYKKSFSDKYQELITIEDDDNEVDKKDKTVQLPDENIAPSISNIERPLSVLTNCHNDINNNSDSEEGEVVEDKLQPLAMDIDEGNSDPNNKVLKYVDKDFVSLKTLKVNDLQEGVYIPEDVLNERLELENQRQWELTKLGEEIYTQKKPWHKMCCNFKILSYNVLSQQLMLDNKYLYTGCDEQCLEWSYRWPLLQHEILHLQPDIMTLQEVEANHYHTNFLPWLAHQGYKCVYKKRTNDKVDGCAIIFKNDMFDLIEEVSVEYNQPYGGSSLNRDNIGLIIKLTPKDFELPFCVATTHLLFNPRRKNVRIAQLAVLFAEIDRLCYKSESGGYPIYCPIILTGDFNSDPYSNEYEFVHKGKVFCDFLRQNYNAYSHEPAFNNELIPTYLGISDYCQHSVLEQSRYLEKIKGNHNLFSLADKRLLELEIIKLFHSSRNNRKSIHHKNPSPAVSVAPSSGVIQHSFLLNSVYWNRNGKEVTTKHDRGWLMVDYIFYTKIKKPLYNDQVGRNLICEGQLKLLGKYRLPSKQEAENLGRLPSLICPSDHFPLAAQFLLTS